MRSCRPCVPATQKRSCFWALSWRCTSSQKELSWTKIFIATRRLILSSVESPAKLFFLGCRIPMKKVFNFPSLIAIWRWNCESNKSLDSVKQTFHFYRKSTLSITWGLRRLRVLPGPLWDQPVWRDPEDQGPGGPEDLEDLRIKRTWGPRTPGARDSRSRDSRSQTPRSRGSHHQWTRGPGDLWAQRNWWDLVDQWSIGFIFIVPKGQTYFSDTISLLSYE